MTEEKPRPSIWITVRFVIYGCVVGFVLWAWFFSGRASEGLLDLLLACLVIPYTVIADYFSLASVPYVMFGQYPVYGVILAEAKRRGRFGTVLLWVVGVHATAMGLVMGLVLLTLWARVWW